MGFFTQLLLHPVAWYRAHQLLVGQTGVNGLLAFSIWLTLYSGQLTLANAGFMAIGAFTAVILTGGTTSSGHAAVAFGVPFPAAVVAGLALAGVVAYLIGLPVLRLKGVYLAIATIGFGEALRFGLILNLAVTGRGQGLNNPHASPGGGIVLIWLSLVVLVYAGWRLTGAKLGQAWAAIRVDELAAASQGVNVAAYKMIAFVAGALIAAYAGSLDAHLNFFVDPNSYGFNEAVAILIFAVVGGIATVLGPVLGAILLSVLPEVFRFAKDYRDVVNGMILIAIVVFLPQGLIRPPAAAVDLRRRSWQAWQARPHPARSATDHAPAGMTAPVPRLELAGVQRSFGGVRALQDVSLDEQPPGTIAGLIGPNGAGKTTLLNLVTGQMVPDRGQIRVDGVDITGRKPHEIAGLGVARTFQNIRLYRELTVLENVLAGMHLHRRPDNLARLLPRRRSAADRGRLDGAAGLLRLVGLDPDRTSGRLSGTLPYGDQRRLEIARALALRPGLLLLDEPAAGMNGAEKTEMRDLLRRLNRDGLTILLIDHDIKLVMGVCDSVTVLNFGRRIATGPPAEVAADEGVITAYLGTRRDEPGERRAAVPLTETTGRERLLAVADLEVNYGAIQAVQGVSLEVNAGEIVALIGANGAGKSTVLNTLSGLLRARSGRADFAGLDLLATPPSEIVRAGLVQVPEGREILGRLTVEENMSLGAWTRNDRAAIEADVEKLMQQFPILRERRRLAAGQLSGGEQQMLAIARALMAKPRLLLLDEPSLGLAPQLVETVFALVESIRAEGITVLLVEQNARRALELADRAYVIETGRVVLSGTGDALGLDPEVQRAYLGT